MINLPGNTSESLDTDYTSYGVGVGYTFDAITVAASYGYIDYDSDLAVDETESYALSAGYDLGGGLALRAAYAQDISDSDDETEKYSFGVMMNF
ncbi:porin [Mangrovicoccus ximenensis]|uniref:porin n=1 Tax=Mangrovicoccus ximenensis TaxID=1911570 RepID=UPI000D383386